MGLVIVWEVKPFIEGEQISKEQLAKAGEFTQAMLDKLPNGFVKSQAWGLDVAVLDNGVLRIIDINCNRGKTGQWSGYMSRPNVLGAYTRHIEANLPVHFAGLSGFLLRNDAGNVYKYFKKRYVEGIY